MTKNKRILAFLCTIATIGLMSMLAISTMDDMKRNVDKSYGRMLTEYNGTVDDVTFNCMNNTDCNDNGECVNGTCHCNSDYAKHDCSYKRKSKWIAFILSILVGEFGVDRFYLGWIGMGVGKLLLVIVWCPLICCGMCCLALLRERCGIALSIVFSIVAFGAMLANIAWYFADWIMILTDDMTDYDGFSLRNNI